MSESISRDQEILNLTRSYITSMLDQGRAPKEIIDDMMRQGYSQAEASTAVGAVLASKNSPPRAVAPVRGAARGGSYSTGMRQMIFGGVICLVGIVITAGTYMAANNNPNGGHYTIAWGAIIFGGFQFFRGLSNLNSD